MKPGQHEENTEGLWRFGKAILKRFPYQFLAILICLLFAAITEIFGLAAILPVISILFNGELTESFLPKEIFDVLPFKIETLNGALSLVVIFMTLRGLLIFCSYFLIGYTSAHLERALREDLTQSLLKASWPYHIQNHGGNFTNAVLKQTEYCAHALLQFGQFLIGVVMASFLLAASVFVSWQAFIIFLLSSLPYLLLGKILNKKMLRVSRDWVEASGKCSGTLIDIMSLSKFIKATALEKEAYRRFKSTSDSMTKNNVFRSFFKAIIISYPEVFGILTIIILIFVMHQLQLISSESFILFLLLMYRAYSQISRIQNSLSALSSYMPSYQAINEIIFDAQKAEEKSGGHEYKCAFFTDIEIESVAAGYSKQDKIIEGINLTIPKNKITAFVGRSGSGKTTLVDTIIGLLEPSSGNIKFSEGASLRTFNKQEFRQHIGYVPQDAQLFRGTIKDNILIGTDDKSSKNLENAAKLAYIDELIESLPNRYDTVVSDRGSSLSGGQRQRIALARALARKPDLLILDEATSSLDNETEKLVHKAITSLRNDFTIILIAHRLSTVKDADIIYMLQDGKIVDSGTFEELMEKNGSFAELYNH